MAQNIQDYVVNKILQNDEELEKLRYLASQVNHCSNCYKIFEKWEDYLKCDCCEKKTCFNCQKGWYTRGEFASYCGRTCIEKEFRCSEAIPLPRFISESLKKIE